MVGPPAESIASVAASVILGVVAQRLVRLNCPSCAQPDNPKAIYLDCLGIPYTGSNPLTLALCIDKIKVKKMNG